jgi:ABC-type transport system substrate-binding protein
MRSYSPSRRRFVRDAATGAALLLGGAGFLLLPAGCNRGNNNDGGDGGQAGTSPASGDTANTEGRKAGTLRYALSTEPTTLDPARVSDGPTIDVLQQIYEGLVGWNEKNEVVPMLAAQMPKVSADGKTYTFTLRENVKFHNGRTVTAEDVKYSLTRALDPGLASPVAMTYLNDIVGAQAVADGKSKDLAGVKVVDPKTVQIVLDAPRAYFLGKLTYPTGYVLDRATVEKGPKGQGGAAGIDENNSVGTGPFKLQSYTRQDKVTLAANADYWNGAPKLTSIERPIVLEATQRHNLYEQGELDILIEMPASDYERDREDPILKDQVKTFDRAQVFYLGMNQTHYAPFRDKRVRQAFAHAIDKNVIVENVLLGLGTRAGGVLPVGIPGYDESFQGLPHDPERAKQLLAEAGYGPNKPLPKLVLTFRQSQPNLTKGAELIQDQLRQIGVDVDLKEMEWAAVSGRDRQEAGQPVPHALGRRLPGPAELSQYPAPLPGARKSHRLQQPAVRQTG